MHCGKKVWNFFINSIFELFFISILQGGGSFQVFTWGVLLLFLSVGLCSKCWPILRYSWLRWIRRGRMGTRAEFFWGAVRDRTSSGGDCRGIFVRHWIWPWLLQNDWEVNFCFINNINLLTFRELIVFYILVALTHFTLK